MSLTQDYFYLGNTENGSPMYRSAAGQYIYYGPDCTSDGQGNKWIISPALCSSGYYDAYVTSVHIGMPPSRDAWFMSCSDGWREVNITLLPLPPTMAAPVAVP